MEQQNISVLNSDSERLETMAPKEYLKVGVWVWVKSTCSSDLDLLPGASEQEWLECICHVGSNYIKLRSPEGDNGYSYTRVYFNELQDVIRLKKEKRHKRMLNLI